MATSSRSIRALITRNTRVCRSTVIHERRRCRSIASRQRVIVPRRYGRRTSRVIRLSARAIGKMSSARRAESIINSRHVRSVMDRAMNRMNAMSGVTAMTNLIMSQAAAGMRGAIEWAAPRLAGRVSAAAVAIGWQPVTGFGLHD